MATLSIIVPVYNCQKHLRECIESIIHQDADLELILIDDGSSDSSLDVMLDYSTKYSFITLIQNTQNQGVSYSRNLGIDIANGKYIMFVDADDYIEKNAYAIVTSQMETHDADMMFIGGLAFDDNGDRDDLICSVRKNYSNPISGLTALKLFVDNDEQFMYCCMVCYKNEYLKKHSLRFCNAKVGEGGAFILQALSYADKVVIDNSYIYRYRIHSDSASHSCDSKQKLLAGQFEQFYTLLSAFVNAPDSEELEAGAKYIYRKMSGGLLCNKFDDNVKIKNNLDNLAKRIVFEYMFSPPKVYGAYDLSAISGKKVIIYGAGHASIEILREANKYNIEVIGFAVTEKTDDKYIYGHKIFAINELIDHSKDSYVLIAANSIYESEIEIVLKEYGFEHIIPLKVKI